MSILPYLQSLLYNVHFGGVVCRMEAAFLTRLNVLIYREEGVRPIRPLDFRKHYIALIL